MRIQSFTCNLFFYFLLLAFSSPLFAQCPPPGFPDPGNTCPDAPILCPDLDGYCSTINNNNLERPFPCCGGQWTLNNDEWFGFFAGTATISIQIVPSNCSSGGSQGLQGAIYDNCPPSNNPGNAWCNANMMDIQCPCTENSFTLNSTDFVVGEVYWIVLDGCNGSVCDYTVNVLEGSTVGFAPDNPGVILGTSPVCNGSSAGYSVAVANGATGYNWTLTPSNAGTLDTDGEEVTVTWSPTFSGFAELCVATSNLCYLNPNESCFTIQVLPDAARSESVSFCPGESVSIGGQVYSQPGMVMDTLGSSAGGCDTIVTYTLTLLPYQTRSENVSFCPGKSVSIGGQVYNQAGTVLDTLASVNSGCDTVVTYNLTLLPPPTRSQTIAFCPGETISLGGTNYTQPGMVVLTQPSTTTGCDTIVTYTLQFLTPAPSNVSITCPSAITIGQQSGSNGAVVSYSQPAAATDCICPGIRLTMTSGLASGSDFPPGTTSVCFAAKDSCGQSASCCFKVTIEGDDPCDTKVNGCIKYELLTITEDPGKNRTYRIRVTNNCPNKLIYTAIQVPDGLVAIEPDNFSIYTAPSGNTYRVRNPNFSPQWSVRYSSISDSINLGESDIFKYTLPAQADVTFIHVVSRLVPYIYLEAHLNTFYCPIGITPTSNHPNGERDEEAVFEILAETELLLFPNPASQSVQVFTGGQTGELTILDPIGRVVLRQAMGESAAEFSVAELPIGLYQVVFVGEKTMLYGSLAVQR
ncbi:MAG: HYR domain-containing protein [Saprospiraceae bacterium]